MFETAVGHVPRGAAPARTRFVAHMPVTWLQLFRSKFDWRYLSDSGGIDRAAIMEGLRVCAKIADAPPLKDLLGSMLRPLGATKICEETLESALSDEARTFYHPVGTCRMGTDPASVVTSRLEVRGVQGLRVADASVMPTIIRRHTHAPSMMIGAKAADLIADANCSRAFGTR